MFQIWFNLHVRIVISRVVEKLKMAAQHTQKDMQIGIPINYWQYLQKRIIFLFLFLLVATAWKCCQYHLKQNADIYIERKNQFLLPWRIKQVYVRSFLFTVGHMCEKRFLVIRDLRFLWDMACFFFCLFFFFLSYN